MLTKVVSAKYRTTRTNYCRYIYSVSYTATMHKIVVIFIYSISVVCTQNMFLFINDTYALLNLFIHY